MQKHPTGLMTWTVCVTVAATMIVLAVLPGRGGAHAQSQDSRPGQSATRLADGNWLLAGGQSSSGAIATAAVFDPVAQTTNTLAGSLTEARAWHSATLLSTGQVLIVGGVGSDGQVLANAEMFDPSTETFMPLALPNAVPRAEHTGTLLTRSIHRARTRHPCPPPHVTRPSTCGRGGPSSVGLEAYSAMPVVATDPVGSVDVVPAISPVLPAPMAAWLRR